MRKSKRSAEEKLTPANLNKVIALLEAEKPITKKEACSILNITYNTTRLANIITQHKEREARDAQKRAQKRGKPLSSDEIIHIVTSYLEGEPVDAIADSIYRGPSIVKNVLDKYAVPIRSRSPDYFHPELIPDEAVRERFKVGERVYSARYDSLAKIAKEEFQNGQWIYRVWLESEKQRQFAYQEASELASLEHLLAIGVQV